jgi:hypothetical protein
MGVGWGREEEADTIHPVPWPNSVVYFLAFSAVSDTILE